jgi:RNA polymerase sigma factor (sigma-70 family)
MSRLEFPQKVDPKRSDSEGVDLTAAHLMLRIQASDVDALEQLMTRYWRNLVGYASQLLGSVDEGKDVAQEVFVRTWEHRFRWKPGGSAETFLYRIARNLSLLQLRRREVRSRSAPELRNGSRRARTPIDDTFSGELREALQEALGELPERRREAFLLVRLDGLSLGAAAEIMGVTKRTVANHVYMATSDLERTLHPFLVEVPAVSARSSECGGAEVSRARRRPRSGVGKIHRLEHSIL